MNLHGNARLTPAGRGLLCRRVRVDGWRVADAAFAAGVSQRCNGTSARLRACVNVQLLCGDLEWCTRLCSCGLRRARLRGEPSPVVSSRR